MRKRDVKIGMEVKHQPSGVPLGKVVGYNGGIAVRVQVDGQEERLATIYEVQAARPGRRPMADQCYWPIGHHNAKDHRCDCICALPFRHVGPHLCHHEKAKVLALATEHPPDNLRRPTWKPGVHIVQQMQDYMDAAADLLDAIDALHQPDEIATGHVFCDRCREPWPCTERRLLHPEPSAEP